MMRYSKTGALFIVIFLLAVALPCHAGWRLITPMPHGRYGHDATLGLDGNIYVMGGQVYEITEKRISDKYNDGRYSSLVYDRKKDEWRYFEPVPGWVMTSKDEFMYYNDEEASWEAVKSIPDRPNNYIVIASTRGKKERLERNIPTDQLRNVKGDAL